MRSRIPFVGLALAFLGALLLVGADAALAGSGKSQKRKSVGTPKSYRVRIQRTRFGIPHIRANDWGGLGYGSGYAFASDNLCVLAREIVTTKGELSRHFGPGEGRLESDFFHRFWIPDELMLRSLAHSSEKIRELVRGYAAGYNRYLRDTGANALPEDCRDVAWVREIDSVDLMRVYYKLATYSGAPNLMNEILAATPPDPVVGPVPATQPTLAALAALAPAEQRAGLAAVTWRRGDLGSNVLALGRDATTDGRGMLFANPHFPWIGPLRFSQLHVTLPGAIDSMGAALFGWPLPQIGFNADLAWSHTVSAAARLTVHQLEVLPEDPTRYRVDGEIRSMTGHSVSVEVREDDGTLGTREHTFYESHLGPIFSLSPFVWTPDFALAVRDVNRDNFRVLDQWLRINRARSVAELARVLRTELAVPFINTAAADRHGNAYYADVGRVPHVTREKLDACATFLSPIARQLGAFLVDGSRSECEPGSDADAPQPGIFGPGNLPSLIRTDYVQNSNDSYWLANPAQRLEGFSPLLGGEQKLQALRTRLGILQAQARLAGGDGLPGNRFSLDALQAIFFQNRNLSAELMRDDVLTLCAEEPNLVVIGSQTTDVSEACRVLAGWDGTAKLDSVGALVWREFWPRAAGIPGLYAVPFDPADPVGTPRGVNLASSNVRRALMRALAGAVRFLAGAGLPLDAAWGDVHFDTRRDGMRIPISGGPNLEGVYNNIESDLTAGEGYTPITFGSSIILGIAFDRKGPVARGVLTYSQSTDPGSPHFSDQTRLFSAGQWAELPFTSQQIRKDPEFSEVELRERRR